MELKWLEDFLALRSEGSFRMAAQARNVSQPAFSRRIQALEAWIGAPLINRSSQPSHLTRAGKQFLPVAQEISALAKTGKSRAQAQVLKEKGEMRFATLSTLSQIFMPAWLNRLRLQVDVTQFVVKTDYASTADYFSALDEGLVDFYISYQSPNNRAPNDPLFTCQKLGEESFIPVVSPNSDGSPCWWLPDKPQNPIPCLHTHSEKSPWPIEPHIEKNYSDLEFDSVYNSSTGTSLKEMAIQGFGVAWLPRTLVEDSLQNGQLVRADLPDRDIFVDINIYRSQKFNAPLVDELWQVLAAQEA